MAMRAARWDPSGNTTRCRQKPARHSRSARKPRSIFSSWDCRPSWCRPTARPNSNWWMERLMTESDWRALEGLLTDFAWHADRGEGDALAALFLPDAVLVVGGQEHRGREQIGADCYRRASDRTRNVRHVWSNLRVVAEEGGRFRTAAVQLTFEQSS